MLAREGTGIPLTGLLSSASTSEYRLLLPTLDSIAVETKPTHPRKRFKKLVADRGMMRDGQAIRERHMTPCIPRRRKPGETDEPPYNEKIKSDDNRS